jgi:hypothetical protein
VWGRWINIEEEQNDLEEGRRVVLVEDEAKRKKIFEAKEALAARLMPVTWRTLYHLSTALANAHLV